MDGFGVHCVHGHGMSDIAWRLLQRICRSCRFVPRWWWERFREFLRQKEVQQTEIVHQLAEQVGCCACLNRGPRQVHTIFQKVGRYDGTVLCSFSGYGRYINTFLQDETHGNNNILTASGHRGSDCFRGPLMVAIQEPLLAHATCSR